MKDPYIIKCIKTKTTVTMIWLENSGMRSCAQTQNSDITVDESRMNKKPNDSFTIGEINTTEGK